MSLKLKKKSEGVWFDFEAEGVEGVRFKIRPVFTSDIGKLRKEIKRKVTVNGDSSTVVDDIDEFELMFAIFKFGLEEWEGIETEEEMTRDEIVEALFDDDDIRDFIIDKINLLTEKKEQREKDVEKN